MAHETPVSQFCLFINPFHIEDLLIFDQETFQSILKSHEFNIHIQLLAQSSHCASENFVQALKQKLTPQQQKDIEARLHHPCTEQECKQAQKSILDALFWELIYWKQPEQYDYLTEGEKLHSAIFETLKPMLYKKTILDIGAGSGRATLECANAEATHIYSIEPSPGLKKLLERKIQHNGLQSKITADRGNFQEIPLADASVDHTISCSAFTTDDERGGEKGLREMKRVTRPGGKIIIIWPQACDHAWFYEHGFHYVSFPHSGQMGIHFRSLTIALQCADLFYGKRPEVKHYLETQQKTFLPFHITGMTPPCDYFWL